MNWIKLPNEKILPKEGKTYWISVQIFGNSFVREATYQNGSWYYSNDNKKVKNQILGWYPAEKPSPLKPPLMKGIEFPAFEVNANGNNKKIRIQVLDEDKMRSLGFTDYREGYWHICKGIPGLTNITFSLSVNKENPNDYRIDVLDEDFCQPYDYQRMLTKNKNCTPALKCFEAVEEYMEWLAKEEIVSGHERGEYI